MYVCIEEVFVVISERNETYGLNTRTHSFTPLWHRQAIIWTLDVCVLFKKNFFRLSLCVCVDKLKERVWKLSDFYFTLNSQMLLERCYLEHVYDVCKGAIGKRCS